MKANQSKPRQEGFTLLELLVVLAIMGLLAAIIAPQVLRYLGSSRTQAARTQIQNITAALDLYKLDVGHFPTVQEGLSALVTAPASEPGWNGPYLRKKKVPADPWNNPYHYVSPGEHGKFDLFTLGADNSEGGEGEDQDVASWE